MFYSTLVNRYAGPELRVATASESHKTIARAIFFLAALTLTTPLTAQTPSTPHNTLTPTELTTGWTLLFNGTTLDHWRTYQKPTLNPGWQAIDGELRLVDKADDIVTRAHYSDFELSLEWKVAEGGNSGVFFRGGEGAKRVYLTAPEVQILDDANHRDGKSPLTSAGSNFGLHPAPRGIVNPANTWNQMRLLVVGKSVRQWLNGQLIVSYELGSDDWLARVNKSKFKRWKNYGALKSGVIALQDHGDPVSFRNIKIRSLALPEAEE